MEARTLPDSLLREGAGAGGRTLVRSAWGRGMRRFRRAAHERDGPSACWGLRARARRPAPWLSRWLDDRAPLLLRPPPAFRLLARGTPEDPLHQIPTAPAPRQTRTRTRLQYSASSLRSGRPSTSNRKYDPILKLDDPPLSYWVVGRTILLSQELRLVQKAGGGKVKYWRFFVITILLNCKH